MKIAISAHYCRGHIGGQIDEIRELEKAGVDVVWVPQVRRLSKVFTACHTTRR